MFFRTTCKHCNKKLAETKKFTKGILGLEHHVDTCECQKMTEVLETPPYNALIEVSDDMTVTSARYSHSKRGRGHNQILCRELSIKECALEIYQYWRYPGEKEWRR